jgi:hypothetical protein
VTGPSLLYRPSSHRAEVLTGGLEPVEVLIVGEADRGAQHGDELVKGAGAMHRQPA